MGDISEVNNLNEDVKDVGKFPWKKLLKVFVVFKLRVPLWSIAIIFVLIFGYMGFNSVTTEDPVNLRPIVKDSKRVDVTVIMCNERVDELDLNIRKEELRLQDKFEKVENAEEARVAIKRQNCSDKK